MFVPTRETAMPPRTTYTRKIIDEVTAKIRSGDWPPGHRLPSIGELADTYGCSTYPVRAAIRELQAIGLIDGHQGVANFVAPQE